MAAGTSRDTQIDIFQVLFAPLKGAYEMLTTPSHHTARMHRIEYLRSLSDAQLDAHGLRREDIVRHVYRHKAAH